VESITIVLCRDAGVESERSRPTILALLQDFMNMNLQVEDTDPSLEGFEEETGPLLKICAGFSANINQESAAMEAMETFESIMSTMESNTIEMCIQKNSEQMAPFPLLTVTANNRVAVVHGIRRLVVPPGHRNNQVLAFINDAYGTTGFPTVIKLNMEDFTGSQKWAHPEITDIMNLIPPDTQVLQIPENSNMVITSKFIPIPLFLVPTFTKEGSSANVLEMFKMFYDEFVDKGSERMRIYTEYILHFLLAATGNAYDETQEEGQLAVSIEELTLDPVIIQWASTQFGGIQHIVALQEEAMSMANYHSECASLGRPRDHPHIQEDGNDIVDHRNWSGFDATHSSHENSKEDH